MTEKNVVRFLIIGDLHGAKPVLHTDNFDAILAPGDICGDDLKPYIKKWIKERSSSTDYNLDFDEFCPKWKQTLLEKKSLMKGRKILKYLNSLGKPVFLVPGNWDHTPHLDGVGSRISERKNNSWEKVKKNLKNIHDIEFKKKKFKGLTLIGHGSVSAPEVLRKIPKSQFDSEEEYERTLTRYKFFSRVSKKLTSLFSSSKTPVIFLSHNVPYKTKLDKVHAPGTYAHNKHYGSILARNLIEEFEPLLCIGGHIHEGFGKTRLKKTLCINTGFGGDVNTIVEIDTKKRKIISVELLGENKEN